MHELPNVTVVEAVADHRLRPTFDDGASGEVDLSGGWRGIFEPLADPRVFRQVEVEAELGTIVWANGADFAPETLHSWATGRSRTAAV
jgi:hypothetical protein